MMVCKWACVVGGLCISIVLMASRHTGGIEEEDIAKRRKLLTSLNAVGHISRTALSKVMACVSEAGSDGPSASASRQTVVRDLEAQVQDTTPYGDVMQEVGEGLNYPGRR